MTKYFEMVFPKCEKNISIYDYTNAYLNLENMKVRPILTEKDIQKLDDFNRKLLPEKYISIEYGMFLGTKPLYKKLFIARDIKPNTLEISVDLESASNNIECTGIYLKHEKQGIGPIVPITIKRKDFLKLLTHPGVYINDRNLELLYYHISNDRNNIDPSFPIITVEDINLFRECKEKNNFEDILFLIEL